MGGIEQNHRIMEVPIVGDEGKKSIGLRETTVLSFRNGPIHKDDLISSTILLSCTINRQIRILMHALPKQRSENTSPQILMFPRTPAKDFGWIIFYDSENHAENARIRGAQFEL